MTEAVGFTTTIPVEVLLAANVIPVDLNNAFISDPQCVDMVARAELDGYPQNVCGWIKGIYGLVRARGFQRIIAVTQGDCSQTHAMIETLQAVGVQVVPFAYPYDRDRELLRVQIQRLAEHLGTTLAAAEAVRRELVPLRKRLAELDRLTWQEDKISGYENHTYLVGASDFGGDVEVYWRQVENVLQEAQGRSPRPGKVRVGLIGVPPIIADLHQWLERLGAQVVYNEVPRQFAMIAAEAEDLVEQYRRYTYPYDVFARIEDIRREVVRRRIDGIIHYVQTFCFRQIQDLLIKQMIPAPVLTLEGDKPAPLDARNRLRLEAFIETLEARKMASP